MDIATIIGLISSLVTIEEAGRGWVSGLFHFCKKKRAKKKIVFVEWDAEDETTQRIIDAFKCGMAAKYKICVGWQVVFILRMKMMTSHFIQEHMIENMLMV